MTDHDVAETAVSEVLDVGRQIEICRRGQGTLTLVLVHGAGDDHDTHAEVARRVADAGLTTVTLSLPGRRGSSGPACTTVAEAAAVVGNVIRRLEGPVVLYGHSLGGGIALELALTQPDLLAGLVLVATGARLRVHPEILAQVRAAAAADHGAVDVGTTPATTTRDDWLAADGFDRLHDLGGCHVRALILGGADDALTPPRNVAWLEDHLPDARQVLVAGAGHFLPIEDPDTTADAIVDFLGEVVP